MPLILDLEQAYNAAKNDPAFKREMDGYLKNYVGRPSPLYFAERLTAHFGGAKIYLKREDLNHTGAHKVNNVLGQIMLAQAHGQAARDRRDRRRHARRRDRDAVREVRARMRRHMGAVDIDRQQPNVMRMKALGAEVRPVMSGSRTLKDAMNEALRDWVTNVANTFYCIGTVAGPHPYPAMVRDFQCVIGNETRAQMQEAEGRLPDSLDRLHRRRLERHGAVPSVPRRPQRRDLRRRGGGPRARQAACGLDRGRAARRAARQPHLSADGRRRADPGGAFDLGRPRLSRHRPGACLARTTWAA